MPDTLIQVLNNTAPANLERDFELHYRGNNLKQGALWSIKLPHPNGQSDIISCLCRAHLFTSMQAT